MVDYNSFVLEGIKILFIDKENEFMKRDFFNDLYDPLINILCIENYYHATGVYDLDDANEQARLLKDAISKYRLTH
ncbi:hypothetical protein NFJ59_18280 [Citrobacter freundii]|nr:hypothetical protein [Citrobacter freundii]WFW12333.1 hypothetical protein NFJ59_18280 [Citrobacter freundii]